jgi:hypothetical protein
MSVRPSPQRVGAAELGVDEAHPRRPLLDERLPADGDPVDPQAVLDEGADGHGDRPWGDDREAQQRRGDRLEVVGVAEEAEHLVGRAVQELFAEEGVDAHRVQYGLR